MASVHQRPASQYWHAAFRGPDGRLILRSTKQSDRTRALAVAMEFERAVKLATRGELVESQARDVLKDIMARADIGETLQTVSIKDWFAEWLATKDARKAASTAARYRGTCDQFLASIGKKATKLLTALTADDVQRYLTARLKAGMAPRTAVLDVKILRTCLNAARRQNKIPTNPAEAVDLADLVGEGGVERAVFTTAEVRMLVDAAHDEWPTLILLAYFTGARLGDCVRLAWADVDLTAGTISYTQSKTGKKVTVPIHPELAAHLDKLASTDNPQPFIMPHMASLKSSGRNGLSQGFKRIMRKAGVDGQIVEGKGVRKLSRRSFHALRHSFTSALMNAGVAPEVRMKLTGHNSEAVHKGYSHPEIEMLRAAVGKLPALNAGGKK